MTVQRAYSLIEFGAVSTTAKEWNEDEEMTLEGWATTPTPDRMQDVVDPMGAQFSLPLTGLLFHDHNTPVAKVVDAKPSKKGIWFKMVLPKGGVLPEIDKARKLVQTGIIRAVSIGFRAIETSFNRETGGINFLKWEWLELSLVSVPANAEATIASVKHIVNGSLKSQGASAHKGQHRVVRLTSLGASSKPPQSTLLKGNDMKTIAEQIAAFEKRRKELQDTMVALVQKTVDEGRTFDETEKQTHEDAAAEIKSIDDHLKVLRDTEAVLLRSATPVTPAASETAQGGVQIRERAIVQVSRNVPKGTAFTRYVMALVRSKGNVAEAMMFANAQTQAKRWDDTPEVERVLKAAVDAGTTTDADWASKLVDYNSLASEFVELLRPMTILGRFGTGNIPSLRRVPFNVRMATQTSGGTYGWVGEGSAKPVGELAIGEILLRWAKASGIIVVTDELMRMSNPSVEAVVRNDMLRGMANFSDIQFTDPDVAEVSNTSPASIFNGATPVPASGTTAENLRADLADLWDKFFTANIAPTTGVFIMSNRQAMRISLMRNALGQKDFPDMTPMGGVLEGFPVIASESVQDTSTGGMVGFVNADDIFYSDDGPVTIDASREASLQMNTTPDNPTTESTVLVSLWQRNLVALRAERYMNWKKRRSAAAQYISNANYGSTMS